MADKESQIAALCERLDDHAQSGNHKKALKAAEDILKLDKSDQDALLAKVVAQVQLQQFEDVIKATSSLKGDDAALVAYEKAYALYRLGKYEDSLAALGDVPEDREQSKMLLEAQVLYRLGRWDRCTSLNEELVFKRKVPGLEVRANLLASLVGAARSGDVPSLLKKAGAKTADSFELAFNVACALIDQEAFTDAEENLLLSQRLGKEMLYEDDCTEEEIAEELAPVTAQLAFVGSRLGRPEEAAEAYAELQRAKVDDDATMAVVAVNLAAERGTKQVNDSIRHLDKVLDLKGEGGDSRLAFATALEARLSDAQKEAVGVNRGLLLVHANKLEQARRAADAVQARFPASEPAVLLQAAIAVRERRHADAAQGLAAFLGGAGAGAAGPTCQLARAQAAALGGDWRGAIDALLALEESTRHRPGVVATLAALYEKEGDTAGAAGALDAALDFWGAQMDTGSGPPALQSLLQAAAAAKLASGDFRKSAELYSRLLESDDVAEDARVDAVAGLVQSTVQFDASAAEAHARGLPPLPGAADVDVDLLERATTAAAPPRARSMAATEGAKEEEEGGAGAGKKGRRRGGGGEGGADRPRKKRKRKPRMPKGFDPENPGPPPDPERWMPKWERSTAKKKKKRQQQQDQQVKGSQGAGKADASLEMKAKAPEPEKPADEPRPVSGKKKGKKGRR